ncbi:AmmeMemoRadiSam system protein B [Niveibacterium sp. SC-1]|uniref:AmmeMemoRadiSam system protein B n=1 Tax=Niveibacterium sp. SC-1 TaxID=3135646 RepID=UPI00311FFF19
MAQVDSIREPAVAGLFYPGDAGALANTVHALLAECPTEDAEFCPKVLVVPHAGYVYSGQVAAQAYARLAPWAARIRHVVLLGPAHRLAFRGVALPSTHAFATPLGSVTIDQERLALLRDIPGVRQLDAAHAAEHSLEVQLPFLQETLPDFSLLPLVVGDAPDSLVAEVLDRLWGGPETLIVVSTDLSHYHPWREARALDAQTAQSIEALHGRLSHEQACGAGPLNGLFAAARRHPLSGELLALCNSGDTAGDRQRVVGYGAFSFNEVRRHEA